MPQAYAAWAHTREIVRATLSHEICPGVMNGLPLVISPTLISRSGSAHAITLVNPTCPNARGVCGP
jgi:hypothetical protein